MSKIRIILSLPLLITNFAYSEVTTFGTLSDFYVNSSEPNQYMGTATTLRVGSEGYDHINRAFFYFDPAAESSIPGNAIINSVTFKIYIESRVENSYDRPSWAQNWNEDFVLYSVSSDYRDLDTPSPTWSSQPTYVSTLSTKTPDRNYYQVNQGDEITFSSAQLRYYVQNCITNNLPVHLGLRLWTELRNDLSYHTNYFKFYESNDSPYFIPKLEIDYSLPVSDTTPPTVSLIGSSSITLGLNDTYQEQGATANDDVDGNITSSISTSGSVDTSTPGMYTITYSVSDSSANSASISRTILVEDNSGTTPQSGPFSYIPGFFTWEEARLDAEARGGRLAVLNTQEKIDAANEYLLGLGTWNYTFIGLTDEEVEGSWKWVTGELLTVDNWNSGEPNGGTRENYGQIYSSSHSARLSWNDTHSGATFSYLLEAIPTPPQFQIIEGDFTWHEAKADAEARGGRLAVLNTQHKIDVATTLVRNDTSLDDLLIGLKRSNYDNNFYWNTGEALEVHNWDDGQPESTEEAVVISRASNQKWHDVPLTLRYDYLLEAIPPPEPLAPVLDLETFYESNSGESITIDATALDGYPIEFSYQWYYNGFTIPSFASGTSPTYTIDGASSSNGTWQVEVTNDVGTTSAEFEFRVFTDADSDGLSDYREGNILGTNPNLADSDSDGLSDYDEVNTHSTNPLLSDTDSDGLSDTDELYIHGTDPSDSDSDDDSLTDRAEVNDYSTDPNDTDSDDDQLSDADEVNTYLTNPNLSDSDNDQLSDYSEINSHLTDPNDSDSDDDGLSDGNEVNTHSTNPLSEDTSGDGFTDGFLVSEGLVPTSDYNALRTETVNQIQDLRVGSTMIEVSEGKADITMTLEETSDLADWSNATTSEMIIEVDAPAGTRFYRFKMTE